MTHKRKRRQTQMEFTDAQTPEVRALINEYGFNEIVMALELVGEPDPVRLKQFAEANRRRATLTQDWKIR